MLNAECGMNAAKSCCAPAFSSTQHSAFKLQHSRHPSRGITLIELLITMTIIAIISALIMGTAASAIENAREKRTQALIAKIHTLIMERYASYGTRRVRPAGAFGAATAEPCSRTSARSTSGRRATAACAADSSRKSARVSLRRRG